MNLPVNEIICGDCLEVMKDWPSDSVDCCVTSPPYWGLRDYGIEGQLGLEKTPEEFVAKMVTIFAEVKRVLKPEGTLWLNLGDSYNGSGKGRLADGSHSVGGKQDTNIGSITGQLRPSNRRDKAPMPGENSYSGLKPKDLCGIPWRVAFALQQDGWYLRQDIIWAKPNPMPGSVTDRCTKAHEYIFLLTKKSRYYYDADAIREPVAESTIGRGPVDFGGAKGRKYKSEIKPDDPNYRGGSEQWGRTFDYKESCKNGRNKRSVWTVTTAPYAEAHFATFPPKLIEPCILAGCPEWVCKKCGKARERIVERSGGTTGESWHDHEDDIGVGIGQTRGGVPLSTAKTRKEKENPYKVETTGWTDCGCGVGFDGGIVFDPFMGSGTTAMVAYENRRNYVGIELNPEYIKLNRADIAKEKYGLFEGKGDDG